MAALGWLLNLDFAGSSVEVDTTDEKLEMDAIGVRPAYGVATVGAEPAYGAVSIGVD